MAEKKHILHFVTPLKNVSPFDVNMAADAGFDVIVPYTDVDLKEVTGLVQDAMFSRAPQDGKRTAVQIGERFGVALRPADGSDPEKKAAAAADAEVVLAAGRAGTQILSKEQLARAKHLLAAVDVNAVPPSGLGGLDAFASGTPIEGTP